MTKVQKTNRIKIAEIRSTFDGLKQTNFDPKHPTINEICQTVLSYLNKEFPAPSRMRVYFADAEMMQ